MRWVSACRLLALLFFLFLASEPLSMPMVSRRRDWCVAGHSDAYRPRTLTSRDARARYECTEANEHTSDAVLYEDNVENEKEEELVDSSFFRGTRLPVGVEESLAALLSRDTVRWIDEQEAQGRADEGGCYRGHYISPDMKELIRGFVKRRQPETPDEIGLLMQPASHHRERGTDVGSPCYDAQKRPPMDQDCRPGRSSASMSFVMRSVEKWLRQLAEGISQKEFVLTGLCLMMGVLSISALLFVYGIADIFQALLHQWQHMKARVEEWRVPASEQLPHRTSASSSGAPERTVVAQKATVRSTAKLKPRDSCKSTSKRRSKPQSKGKHDGSDTKRENKSVAAKAKTTAKETCEDAAAAADANNEWKEVMHNKPKGRTSRAKHEEEKIFPQTKKLPASQPATPKTPPQLPPAVPHKSERDSIKPIKTKLERSDDAVSLDEPSFNLQVTMTTSGAFSDEMCHSGKAYCSLPCGEQMNLQQSPFAASMELPFSSSYVTHPTEEQVQSKIDCLLRNLRNKPFSAYPVTQSPLHPIRRSVTDLEEHMLFQRRLQLHSFFGDTLDPAFSSSGSLNNRMCLPPPSLHWNEDPRRCFNGLPPISLASRTQQRAGSLPLTPTQSNLSAFPALRRQGPSLQSHPLSRHMFDGQVR